MLWPLGLKFAASETDTGPYTAATKHPGSWTKPWSEIDYVIPDCAPRAGLTFELAAGFHKATATTSFQQFSDSVCDTNLGKMRFTALLLRALLTSLSLTLVSAVYRDEAYTVDYQHALLGTPSPDNILFHRPSPGSNATLLYSLSAKNVLGAVNPKDGSLVWRQDLSGCAPAGTPGFLRPANGTSMVISAVGSVVRAWDAGDGKMVWEFEAPGTVKSLVVPDIIGVTQDPVISADEEGSVSITTLNLMSGMVVWDAQNVGDIPIAVTSSASSLYYVSLQSAMLKGYKTKVTAVDPVSAQPLDAITLSSDSEVTSEASILYVGSRTTSPVLIWADKSFKTLKINILGTKHVDTVKVTSKSKDVVENISIHAPSSIYAANHFLIHYQTANSHWAEIYHVDKEQESVKKASDLPVEEGKGAFSVSMIGASVFFTKITSSEVSLVVSSTGDVLDKWPLQLQANISQSDLPDVIYTVTEVVAKGASKYAVRSALTLSNGDVELVRNGEPDWIRDESLAGITAAAWAEFPATEDLARELAVESHSNPLSAYVHRVKRHIKDLEHLPNWVQNIPTRMLGSLLGGEQLTGSDQFGFSKVVIVTTERGRMMALDAGKHGKVMWNIQAVKIPAGTLWNVTDISVEDDLALVTASGAEFILVETMTGKIRQYQAPGSVGQVDRFISISKGSGKRTLVPIFANGAPGEIPEGDFGNDTFIVTQRWDGTLAGWNLVDGKTPTGAWIFSPKEGESVNAVASRPTHDPVASIGRALGDRNVLYKYLSNNLVVVSTVNPTSSTASVYLLDTTTGEALYTTTHRAVDTTLSISVTFSENWFAYTLYTDPSLAPSLVTAESVPKAHILTISELFESPTPNDRGPLGVISNFSSLSSPAHAPHVVSASYVISAPLTHLATTSTKQGITPRSLLAYSAPLAAIFAIPSSFFSPRKPVGRPPTAAESEEGLFSYSPLFDLNSQWAISHEREILGIKAIMACPTLMESSSLVFAYGDLDVFGTRVAPIGTFDLLGKGFNRVQLVLTVVGLALGTGLLAPLARKRLIDGLWRN